MGQHWTLRSQVGQKPRMKLRKLSRGTWMSGQWAGPLAGSGDRGKLKDVGSPGHQTPLGPCG